MKLTLDHIKEAFPILCRIPDAGLLFEPRHMAMAFMGLNRGCYPAAWNIAAVISDIIEDEPYSKTMLRLQGYRAVVEQFLMFADSNPAAYVRTIIRQSRNTSRSPASYRRALVNEARRTKMVIPDTLLSNEPDKLSTVARVRMTQVEIKYLQAQAVAKGYVHESGRPNLSAYMRHRLLDTEENIR